MTQKYIYSPPPPYKILPVVTRREYREILLARMAGGDLYASEELANIRKTDMLLDALREHPIYTQQNLQKKDK